MEDPAPDVSLEEMLATRLGVSGVSVLGAERTRADFLNYVLSPLSSTPTTSFEAVVENVSDAVDRLRSTGCYKGVDAYLDRDAVEPSAAHVTFTVAEKSLYQIRTGTSVATSGDRDASVDGSLIWRNILGRAETLRATVGWWGGGGKEAFGTKPSNSLEIDVEKPFFPTRSCSVFGKVGQSLRNHEDASSYAVNVRSVEAGVATPLGRFSARGAWREVCDVGEKASMLVRDDAGHSFKTSLIHRIQVEERDDACLPTAGYAAALESEVAGGIGDVTYGKCEASGNVNVPLGASGIAVSLSARGGVVCTGAGDSVRICDRFHLGGASSLRGFRARGVGPRDGRDALGGETFYVATAMVSLPTPETSLFSQMFGARVHAFATAGDVGSVTAIQGGFTEMREGKSLKSVRGVAERVAKSSRVAVGLGIAGETALGRVEINFCNVLRCAPGDHPKSGFQFGLTQSFL